MCRFLDKCFQFSYLGAGLLGHALTPCSTFLGTCQGFSKVAAPFYVPSLGGQGSNFSILIGAHNSDLAIVVGVKWYLNDRSCVFLMTHDAEHLFYVLL